ncbi:MAG: EAL domain-containing protein [Chloroflexota bacterium]
MQLPSAPTHAPPAHGARTPPSWIVLLGLTPLLALIYALLPTAGDARVVAYPIYGACTAVVIALAAVRTKPARRGAWLLIALAVALLTAGDVTYSVIALSTPEVPFPSFADLGYLSGYVALVAGVIGLIRRRTTGNERMAMLDAAILTTGVAAGFWITIMLPSISGSTDPLAIVVSLAYPGADLVLLLVGLHALLGGAARPRFLQIMIIGLAIYFVADVLYAVAVLDGSYVFGDPVDLAWITGLLLVGVASLHPSTRAPVVVMAKVETRLSRRRFALLAFAAFLAPALLVTHGATADVYDIAGLVLAWTVPFALVLVRLTSTVDELGKSLVQRRQLQDDLAYQATHDSLTRLANRALFETRLEAAVAPDPKGTGLIFLDLDDFKTVNDTLGHAIGDVLLQTLAARIEREVRGADLVARLGGDEFAILMRHCPDEATLRSLAERILVTIRAPVALAGRHLVVHASAGMAFGRPGRTGLDLMRDADVAMYQAKSKGKDQVERHVPAMHEAIIRGYELRSELAAAVVARDFIIEYQPVMDIRTGAIVAGEALVRWRHPTRGVVPPGEFIGIAEASGLIHELGRWILREACVAAATWPTLPDGRGRSVGVNLAPAQLLGPKFHDQLVAILDETGIDPTRLTLEITESALIDLEAAATALAAISKLGVKLALDDFGTGYSALSYLADLPFDIIKIDQSFVSGMGESERVESLLQGILGLCRSLGLLAVAEGVETEAQLARLRRLGCPEGQGFLFARPMSLGAFEALLASDASREPIPTSKFRGAVSLAPEA